MSANNVYCLTNSTGKKASQHQLQLEVNNDDGWNAFIQKSGLLVVDVYCEWCGPCLAMVTTLKKLKVEVGGENLHFAVACSDHISSLKRFRNSSEPKWLFICGGLLVNIMFGADAPKLTRMIIEELKKAESVRNDEAELTGVEIHQLTPIEQEIEEHEMKVQREIEEFEESTIREEWQQRRTARADLLEVYIKDYCPVLLWPHASKNIKRMTEPLLLYGIALNDKYPLLVTAEIQKVLFEGDERFADHTLASEALNDKPATAALFKLLAEQEGDILEIMNRVMNEELLIQRNNEMITLEMDFTNSCAVPGFYLPADRFAKAVAVDLLFPKLTHMVPSELPLSPPHWAMLFSAFKRRDVLQICQKYSSEILALGFFADQDLQNPRNITTEPEEYENLHCPKEYSEVIALKVVKRSKEALKELRELEPLYISHNIVQGREDCMKLFPSGYGAPLPRKTKTKKKKAVKSNQSIALKEETSKTQEISSIIYDQNTALPPVEEASNSESEDNDDTLDSIVLNTPRENIVDAQDKSTSPMPSSDVFKNIDDRN